MPKFSEDKKNEIREALMRVGEELFIHYGLKKVNVDDVIEKVGISHGSFYTFFKNKEHLFMEIHVKIQEKLFKSENIQLPASRENHGEAVADYLEKLFISFASHPFLSLVQSTSWEGLTKKVPRSVFEKNDTIDSTLAESLCQLGITFAYPMEMVVKSIQSVFYCGFQLLQEDNGREVLRLLFKGVVKQLIQ